MCLGIPGQVVEINDAVPALGTVEIAGVRREVNLSCVLPPDRSAADLIGSWVLVHVGFAMASIDEDEARRTLALISELSDAQDEIRALRDSAEVVNG